MLEEGKGYYSLSEVLEHLGIPYEALAKRIRLFNMGTISLPGSREEHISAADVRLLERNIKEPSFLP